MRGLLQKLGLYSLKTIGYLLLISGFLICFYCRAMQKAHPEDDENGGFYILSILLFTVGLFFWRRAKKMLARLHAAIDLEKDNIVLYLRSFNEDAKLKKTYSTYLLYPSLPFQLTTQEENLARTVKKYGILTAIGIPKEELPFLGATRLQFEDSEWQKFILKAIACSKLIILRAGETQGCLWELNQVMMLRDKSKVMILMPGKNESYQIISAHIKHTCGIVLPPFSEKFFANNDINCILYFDKQNQPKLFFPKLFYFQFVKFDPFSNALKKCLKERAVVNRTEAITS